MDYSIHIVFLIICAKCVAVNIKQIEVPALVEIGTEFVILDCHYSIQTVTPRIGLVLKWFYNGSSGLVYQWIPPLMPQVIGLLKGKVDMNFRISDEPLQAYRAIKILKPTTDLSGNYTCVVSTFLDEDRQTRSMLVYSPARRFHFFQEKKYVFLVTLTCIAEDMYPKPIMVILSQGEPLKQAVTEVEMDSWGLYTLTTKAVVHDDDVASPWEEFTCVISIPQANYTVNKTTTYYPGGTHLQIINRKKTKLKHLHKDTRVLDESNDILIVEISSAVWKKQGFMPTAYIAAYEIQKPEERYVSGNTASSIYSWHVWILIILYVLKFIFI